MQDSPSFAARLAEQRKKLGLSQAALAARVGAKQQTVSDWENGETQPSVDEVAAMAKLFACTSDYLLCLSDVPSALPPGHYVVDDERVEMIRRKEIPPDRGRWAWPIPERHRVLKPTDYELLRDDLYGSRKKKREGDADG